MNKGPGPSLRGGGDDVAYAEEKSGGCGVGLVAVYDKTDVGHALEGADGAEALGFRLDRLLFKNDDVAAALLMALMDVDAEAFEFEPHGVEPVGLAGHNQAGIKHRFFSSTLLVFSRRQLEVIYRFRPADVFEKGVSFLLQIKRMAQK